MTKVYKYDVFISHSRANAVFAQHLAARLREMDFDVWVPDGLATQQSKRIVKAMENSAVCVLLFSDDEEFPWTDKSVWSAISERIDRSEGRFRVIPVWFHDSTRVGGKERIPSLTSCWTSTMQRPGAFVRFNRDVTDEAINHLVRRIRGIHDAEPGWRETLKEQVRFRARDLRQTNWSSLANGLGQDLGFSSLLAPLASGRSDCKEEYVPDTAKSDCSQDDHRQTQAMCPPPAAIAQNRGRLLTRYRVIDVTAVILVVGLSVAYVLDRTRTVAKSDVPASIAILPFRTIGSTDKTEVLSLGMADALIVRLSRLNQTTVLPTSSVWRYTNREQDAVSIGQALRVEAVLDGTVERDGDQVRITVQLIRLADRKSIWTAKDYGNLFVLQETISEQLAFFLNPNLSVHENDRRATRGTVNQEAYEAYLTGLNYWNQQTKESLTRSLEYFERATQKDPNYGLAHALLGDVYFLSYADDYDLVAPEVALVKANVVINRALQLDESIAEAHVTKAGLLRMDPEGADREYRRALELNPNLAVGHLRYSYWLFNQRRLDEALAHSKRAVELDPTSPVSHNAYGFMLSMSRDTEGAAAQYAKALELQPDQVAARYNIANVYAQKRMFKEALAEVDRIGQKDRILGTLGRAYVYASSRRRDAARQELSKLEKENPERVGPLNVVVLYGMIGDKDTAFDLLNKIEPGPFVLARLKFDPNLDPLRGEQGFGAYLTRHHIELDSPP